MICSLADSAISTNGGGSKGRSKTTDTAQVTTAMEDMTVENKRRSTIQNDGVSDTGNYQGTDFPPEETLGAGADTVNYDAKKMIGHGSFGAVFLANVVETGEIVAIKKVLQDKRFKNR